MELAVGSVVEERVRIIVPARRRLRLRSVVEHRNVIRVLAMRDFKGKYKQSLFGPLWLFVQPITLVIAMVVVFSGAADVDTGGVPYLPFALVGLAVWSYFQAALTMGAASIVSNPQIVRRTACPRIAMPLSSLIACLPALGVTLVAALVAVLLSGEASWRLLLLPLSIGWLLLLTAGAVFVLAAVSVRARDVLNALPFLLQFGLFVTPVGYPFAELSGAIASVIQLNPLTGLIEVWRWMAFRGTELDLVPVALSLAVTALICWAGWLLFTRLEVSMADDI